MQRSPSTLFESTSAIVIERHGGPDVLMLREVSLQPPNTDEVRLRHTRIGVNYHDVYCRSGLYQTLALPGIPGIEAVGIIEAVGSGMTAWRAGDRAAYVTGRYGVYAASRNIEAGMLDPVPSGVTDAQAASALLRGLTVDMLVHRVCQLRRGQTVLVQAASGGMGQLLAQWASHLGAVVIGTVRRQEQVDAARASGCRHVVLQSDDVAQAVLSVTGGRGVDVAYDAVGLATFEASLASLALCGHLVNYGQASGPVPPLAVSRLAARSSSLTRPILFHYLQDAGLRREMTARVFDALTIGWLKVQPPREFPLVDASSAHALIEREGAGRPILLVPGG